MNDFITHTLTPDYRISFREKHGWVQFVSNIESQNHITTICEFIKKYPRSLVQNLADAKDDDSRKAIELAVKDINKLAFQESV